MTAVTTTRIIGRGNDAIELEVERDECGATVVHDLLKPIRVLPPDGAKRMAVVVSPNLVDGMHPFKVRVLAAALQVAAGIAEELNLTHG